MHQVPNAHQIVSRARERKDPIDLQRPAMPHFAQQRHGLQPAKTFFDALPLTAAAALCAEENVVITMVDLLFRIGAVLIAGSLNLFPFPSTGGRTPDSSPVASHPPRNL